MTLFDQINSNERFAFFHWFCEVASLQSFCWTYEGCVPQWLVIDGDDPEAVAVMHLKEMIFKNKNLLKDGRIFQHYFKHFFWIHCTVNKDIIIWAWERTELRSISITSISCTFSTWIYYHPGTLVLQGFYYNDFLAKNWLKFRLQILKIFLLATYII